LHDEKTDLSRLIVFTGLKKKRKEKKRKGVQ
jgi:hypothetical protein